MSESDFDPDLYVALTDQAFGFMRYMADTHDVAPKYLLGAVAGALARFSACAADPGKALLTVDNVAEAMKAFARENEAILEQLACTGERPN